jgi:hypothetical protein
VVAPAVVAVLTCLIEARGPLAASLHRIAGIVPGYFASIALLFALVTAQYGRRTMRRARYRRTCLAGRRFVHLDRPQRASPTAALQDTDGGVDQRAVQTRVRGRYKISVAYNPTDVAVTLSR